MSNQIENRLDKVLLEMLRLIFSALWYSETKIISLLLTVLQEHHNNPNVSGTKEACKSLKRAIDGLDQTLTKCRKVYIKKEK